MQGNDGYIRSNTNPGAVLNIDNSGLEAYRRHREMMKKVYTHEDRLMSVEQTMNDVKTLLEKLLEQNGKDK
jgi:hypothetical protein